MIIGEPIDEDGLRSLGYANPRKLPTGEWCAVYDYLFTGALLVNLNTVGYEKRYCYATREEAEAALENWDGTGDPPGPWIKAKGERGGDRLGPGATEGE